MKKLLFIIAFAMLVSACGMSKKDLGLEKKIPDASQATSKEELILPPNFNLRPVVPMTQAKTEQE